MVKTILPALLTASLVLAACGTVSTPAATAPATAVPPSPAALPTETAPLPATETPSPAPVPSPTETPTAAAPAPPTVDSLPATVSADLLSCRYGPGPEYLFLYGLRKGARIKLIGQTGGNNWVWVDGKNKCWVNVKFLEAAGDFKSLPVVYPDQAPPLLRSPYYPPTTILSATRDGNQVTVKWLDIPLRPGDEEDAAMLHYIVEVWRCEAGQIVFDPLATNDTSISFMDESGCAAASHGRVFVQEKHGFAGPSNIPWP